MKARKNVKMQKTRQPSGGGTRAPQERGINLDVSGTALIRQTDERIAWHQRSVTVLAAELNALSKQPGGSSAGAEDLRHDSRRPELTRRIYGHQEYSRFLRFVKRHIRRSHTYRLTLPDLSVLEIMPKGSYL